jgi:hypothetical protein
MNTSLNFQIGNQEVVNFLVEQRMAELTTRKETLHSERWELLERVDADKKTMIDKMKESVEQHIKHCIAPALESMGIGKRIIKAFLAHHYVSIMHSQSSGKHYFHVSVNTDSSNEDVGWLADVVDNICKEKSVAKPPRVAPSLTKDLKRIEEINNEMRAIDAQLADRINVERSALAQMTRKLLEDNPQVLAQLQQACIGISSATPLLS